MTGAAAGMIRLEGIARHFRMGDQEVRALDGVDLAIDAGEYVSIMGPSGSGKSTLLNVLGLLDRPDAGRYLLDGADVAALSEPAQAQVRRTRIGFVFQSFHLVARLTAFENIELPLVLEGIAPAERRRRVEAALGAIGLAERAHHTPNELSGGQRQRVAIARATILQPAVLLADEPTGNRDAGYAAAIMAMFRDFQQVGTTLVIATHDERAITALGGRTLHLDHGRIGEVPA